MKKLNFLLVIFAAIFAAISFNSCGDDEPGGGGSFSSDLYGEWVYEVGSNDYFIEFRDEGDEDDPKDHDYMFWFEGQYDYFKGHFSASKSKIILKAENGSTYSFSYSIKGDAWKTQTLVLTPSSEKDAMLFGIRSTSKIVLIRDL